MEIIKNLSGSFDCIKSEEENATSLQLVGYATTWNNKDLAGDVILKESVNAETVIGKKILTNHDKYDVNSAVGTIISAEKDDHGLKIIAEILKSPRTMEHLIPSLEKGLIKDFSIGFRATKWDKNDSGYIFKEIDIREVSLVSFPANEQANILTVKQEDTMNIENDKIKELQELVAKTADKDAVIALEKQIAEIKDALLARNTEKGIIPQEDVFLKYLVAGNRKQEVIESSKALAGNHNSIINADGGILVPQGIVNEIIDKTFSENGSLRSLISTQFTGAKFSAVGALKNLPRAYYRAESQKVKNSKVDFETVYFSAKSLGVATSATWEFLNYQGAFARANLISSIRQAYANKIDYDIINGDASVGMEGILKSNKIEIYTTENTAELTYKDIMNASAKLRIGANPTIVMHKRTYNKLMLATDSQNAPIYNFIANSVAPNMRTFMGFDLVLVGDVDLGTGSAVPMIDTVNNNNAFVSNKDVVLIGNFNAAYRMMVSRQMTMVEDNMNDVASQIINWYAFMDIDGKVLNETAMIKVRIK